uniref:Uncharacterized protein n=1 Tax=Ditylenchus dipsaci TaxID=166011 RepID=A0A915ET36_9BILA
MQHEDWPILEFPELKGSILGKFSDVQVNPSAKPLSKVITSLRSAFYSASAYQTLSSAVRIYLVGCLFNTVDSDIMSHTGPVQAGHYAS